jgi:hypothetical protein
MDPAQLSTCTFQPATSQTATLNPPAANTFAAVLTNFIPVFHTNVVPESSRFDG